MKKWLAMLLGGASLFAVGTNARATIVVADFNDITSGGIFGKAGGTDLSGTWTGSTAGTVIATDLTSSKYTLAQSGTAQHYRNTNSGDIRQNFRSVTVSPTGTVWFSFLAEAVGANDIAGISINPSSTASPFNLVGNQYVYLSGSTLNYSFGAGTAGTATNAAPVGSVALIVGKMNIVTGGGADSIQLWVNPDLVANPDITAYTPVYSNSSVDFIDSLTTLGVVGEKFTTAGDVDNIRFSDGGGNATQAFADVALPEPTSMMGLAALVGFGLARRSRRDAR